MSYLIFRLNGVPFYHLENVPIEDLAAHVCSGYPHLVGELNAGNITGEIVDSVAGITFAMAESREERRERLVRLLLADPVAVENRLRALEGKAVITEAEFVTEAKVRVAAG
jgi:hypothetical protein